jgi:hypothetical protein
MYFIILFLHAPPKITEPHNLTKLKRLPIPIQPRPILLIKINYRLINNRLIQLNTVIPRVQNNYHKAYRTANPAHITENIQNRLISSCILQVLVRRQNV